MADLPVNSDVEFQVVSTSSNPRPTTKVTQRNLLEVCTVLDNATTNFLIYTLSVDTFSGGQIPTSVDIREGNVSNRFKVNLFSNNVQLKVDNAASLAPGGYTVDLIIRLTFDKADLQVDRRIRVVVQVA